MRRRPGTIGSDCSGTAMVEFAILLPLLAALLTGILFYGQYFLLAHGVQQIANDAARATIPGLDAGERAALAQACVSAEAQAFPPVDRSRVAVRVSEAQEAVTVRVTLDASGLPLFAAALVPMPDPVIDRRATVLAGGIT